MNPPWILLNLIVLWACAMCECANLDVHSEESNSTAKERNQREITERERRLIPYMTFYLARNVGNSNSGERQNVLIPIQVQQSNVERISAVSQVQTNNIQNVTPQRFEVSPTPSVAVQFPDNGFYPTPSIELTAKTDYKNQPEPVKVLSQIYRFKSPGPHLQHRPQQVHHRLTPHQTDRPAHQQVQSRQRLNQKYAEPQVVKIIPYHQNYDLAQYSITTQRPQHTYTSAHLQSLTNNPYLLSNQYYFKDNTAAVADGTYIPGKVFSVNIIPQIGPKISVQRLSPDQRQEKTNVNQIFIGSTAPTPYRQKVKFELEDARLPNLVNVVPVEKVENHIPLTYVPEQISTNYIGERGHLSEAPNKEQNIYLTHEVSQQRPTHVTFVPVQTQSPSLNPQTIEIKHVGPLQRTPDSQIDQIQIVEQVNTPRPHGHDANDIRQAHQEIGFEDYNKETKTDDEGKSSVDNSLVNLLTILKQTNQLPQNFTPENIDNSIKTLALILQRLQNERKYQTYLASSKTKPSPKPSTITITENKKNKYDYHHSSQTGTPGRAGIDYPTYATIPQTQFNCATQRYKGFFGDPDTNCQVWHYCDLNGGQASFLCPNGTIFSQVALTCDWWFNVKCASTSQLYVLNERLYKYILPFSPSFPEDYSGPLVDRYLAAKFKEMEAKSRLKALKALISTSKPELPKTQSSTDPSPTTPSYNTETQ